METRTERRLRLQELRASNQQRRYVHYVRDSRIIRMREQGLPLKAIADAFNLTNGRVWQILAENNAL